MPTLAGGNPFLVNDGVDIAEIDAEVRAVPDRKRCIRRFGRRDSRRRWPRVFSVGAKHEFILERRIEHGLERTRGQDRTCGRTGHEHAADVRDDAGAAITHARTGAEKLWAGTMVVQPDAKTGPHHHGELETVLYVVKGRVRMRWGDHLELSEEARAGDFIYVPPYVPHQEINGSPNEICEAVVVRSGQAPVVVNLDVETPEPASAGHPGMPFHPGG